MKTIFILFFCTSWIFPQSFEIKQITSGDFDARNPFIPAYSFSNEWFYFEKHSTNSSNIILIKYDPFSNSFQDTVEITSGNLMNINPYEDFNQGIVFQTNENGNWDITYRKYIIGLTWGPTVFLTNTVGDEINLSPFYSNEYGFPYHNYILYERSDTIFVMEYSESMLEEYPVLINTNQYQYSDYIGIVQSGFSGNYPRPGIHVIAVETDSTGNKKLISKYKPENGSWESINIIKGDCDCSNPILQYYEFIPYLIFEDTISNARRTFRVYDWDQEKNIEEIPIETSGHIRNFRIDRPHIITESPNEIGPYPYSYFVSDSMITKIRLNKEQTGEYTTDTLINVKYPSSKMVLGSFGVFWGENFYTIWEDSIDGHIQLFGRWHDYPITDVEDNSLLYRFNLDQNYPNPFNPTTKISWQVPLGDQQTLKIFDVLGKEVATLVDEYKPTGKYEVEFDASSLPSGIYFCQLKAGGIVITKKMLLLK